MVIDFMFETIAEVDSDAEGGSGGTLVEPIGNSNSSLLDENLLHNTSSYGIVANPIVDKDGMEVIAISGCSSTDSYSEKCGVINMAHMNLTTFPPDSMDCSRLNNIDLSVNSLHEIPSVFLQNKFCNVEMFNLSFNKIKEIPESFSNCFPKLKYLNISSNQMENLPLSLKDCRIVLLNCSDNPFHFALQGIIGGNLSTLNYNSINSALNMRYFFGLINFYISLDEFSCEAKDEILGKWADEGNYKADIFLKLVNAYRSMDTKKDALLSIKAKWVHQKFSQIAPDEVKKFSFEPSMESLDSFLNLIEEKQPVRISETKIMDVENENTEKDVVEGLKTEELESEDVDKAIPEVVDNDAMPEAEAEVKSPTWTQKERRWFLGMVTVIGLIGCYLIFWPFFAALLVSSNGLELLRKTFMSRIIPYWWTSLLALFHSLYQGWIFKFIPHIISKHLPLINYKLPIWQKIWAWISSWLYRRN